MFSHKDVLPPGRILVFMITLGKTFFYLSVSTFIIAVQLLIKIGCAVAVVKGVQGCAKKGLPCNSAPLPFQSEPKK